MFFKSSKINEFRLWGLLLTMGGMAIMIVGLAGIVFDWGKVGKLIAAIFMVLGMIVMLGSVIIYFWAGMLSTSAVSLVCPECNKMTKMLGKTDRCMFCKTILTFDAKYADDHAHDHKHSPEQATPTS
ncbi:YgzB family protein [Paenibacillus koleovorans]|uniref:YgzB family protein n=1 Tax=Paenibacillus koleovorans TaxID=121608 RepID=UPI000FDC667E|nr:YgzB family protein [Paenibacillus koleovorans]